ncbi:MAG: signal recognition particle subunit SRP19/SEC65 family protein [Sulfolobales archaeon]|nr:hypothetical protein [Sulfolobales archaeon]MCX8185671.1 hypothetical protein [Sulfolobales archaeon]MDW7969614.1 signal recognition particle subunit SRP19/SEC65 family protein [Sulfolobales archaeon]
MGNNRRVLVVWPQYLDSTLPRRLGRKLSKHYSVVKPTVDELLNACRELRLECNVDRDVRYSRVWYLGVSGRILVHGVEGLKKLSLLKTLSNKVRELRTLGK